MSDGAGHSTSTTGVVQHESWRCGGGGSARIMRSGRCAEARGASTQKPQELKQALWWQIAGEADGWPAGVLEPFASRELTQTFHA